MKRTFMQYRYENFGGIIAGQAPLFLGCPFVVDYLNKDASDE